MLFVDINICIRLCLLGLSSGRNIQATVDVAFIISGVTLLNAGITAVLSGSTATPPSACARTYWGVPFK